MIPLPGVHSKSWASFKCKSTPGFLWARGRLGETLLAQGKPEVALAMLQQDSDEELRLVYLPIFLQAAGRRAEADEALQAQIARGGARPRF